MFGLPIDCLVRITLGCITTTSYNYSALNALRRRFCSSAFGAGAGLHIVPRSLAIAHVFSAFHCAIVDLPPRALPMRTSLGERMVTIHRSSLPFHKADYVLRTSAVSCSRAFQELSANLRVHIIVSRPTRAASELIYSIKTSTKDIQIESQNRSFLAQGQVDAGVMNWDPLR